MAIRPLVKYRDVPEGFRPERRARDFAMVYSVLKSQRKKEKLAFMTDPE